MMPPPPIYVPSFTKQSVQKVRMHELQSLVSSCSAHTLTFFALPDYAPSTLKMWFPVCSQGGRRGDVLPAYMDPKIDLQASLAVFLQHVFFMKNVLSDFCCHHLPSRVCISFVSKGHHSMAMALSCVVMVAKLGFSASVKIASASRLDLSGDCSSSIPQTDTIPATPLLEVKPMVAMELLHTRVDLLMAMKADSKSKLLLLLLMLPQAPEDDPQKC